MKIVLVFIFLISIIGYKYLKYDDKKKHKCINSLKSEFKYGDRVSIKGDFYEGNFYGTVVGQRGGEYSYGKCFEYTYAVTFDDKNRYFHYYAHELELISKGKK